MIKLLAIYVMLIFPLYSAGSMNEKGRIVYHLKLGFIKGGQASIDISDTTYQGNKAIHYTLKARTTGLADLLYKVYDTYETTANAESLLPYVSIRNIREQNYRYYNEVTYHRDIDSIYSQRSGWKKAPDNLIDIITLFFYFTNKNYLEKIDKGDSITLPIMHADEINNINIKFLGFEKIKTKLGELECYVLSPYVKKGKLLKRSDGVRFYITKDTKIPVLLEFDLRVGSLKAVLADYDTDGP